MPGINVITQTRSGPTPDAGPATARYMVAGLTERGSVAKPILVRSMAEYEALCGTRVPYGFLYDDLKTFFEEGGGEALIARVVGPAATIGTLQLVDRAGSPLPTLRVDAASPGAWSARLKVQVQAGTLAGTFRLTVTYDDVRVHDLDNLTSPGDAAAALVSSTWVKVTDLGSVTAAPNNQPAILAATALSAGVDDRASVTASLVAAALARFGDEYGTGAVATPGYTATQVGATLLAHAKQFARVALMAGSKTDTVSQIKSTAGSLVNSTNGEHGTLLYPWVQVPDGALTRAIPPEGYAAGCRARAHRTTGPWRAPAGQLAAARYVVAPFVDVNRAVGDDLDAAQVSAIRFIQGGTRLYGWRSLSTDTLNYPLLVARDTLNYLAVQGAALLEPYVFATIDGRGQLLGRIKSTLVGLVDPLRAAGGLYPKVDPVTGEQVDPGYSVDVSPSVNPASQLAASKVAAVVAVRVAPVGTLIELTIVKAGLDAQV